MAMSRNEIIQKLVEVMAMTMPDTNLDFANLREDMTLVGDLGLSSVGVYNDYVLLAPKEQRMELRWYETERLCMALCAESIPESIHIEKLELV